MKHPRILEELIRHQWAITPEALSLIYDVAEGRQLSALDEPIFHGARAEIAESIGEVNKEFHYSEKIGNVGVIRVEGPIVPRASWINNASGLTSTELLGSDLEKMALDQDVDRVVMVYDSPGGAVTGISELQSQIREFEKPITAYVFGIAASAAYWLASAADEIVASDTSMVGSIGAIVTIGTPSQDGKVRFISSQSPRKNQDPTTDDGKASYQEMADDLAEVFVRQVAENRSVSVQAVLDGFGKGAMLVAEKAKTTGMIDRVSTFTSMMKDFEKEDHGKKKEEQHPMFAMMSMESKEQEMNLQEFLASNPEAKQEFDKLQSEVVSNAQASLRQSLEVAAKVATGSEYPQVVKNVAAEVIAGKKTSLELDAFMTMAELHAESVKSEQAKKETEAAGDTTPQLGTKQSTDGAIRTGEDFQAALDRLTRKAVE